MQQQAEPKAAEPTVPSSTDTNLLHKLLAQPSRSTSVPAIGSAGIAIGTFEGYSNEGITLIGLHEYTQENIPAMTLIDLQHVALGAPLAIAFAGAPPEKPLILGAILNPNAVDRPAARPEAETTNQAQEATDNEDEEDDLDLIVDGRHVELEAHETLELRCGKAALLMSADGRITLRGTYITSQASATQRILGGSVSIN